MDGIRKNQTIITPCIVKSLLYVSALTTSPAGLTSSRRISVAAAPPIKKNSVMEIAYKTAIRL